MTHPLAASRRKTLLDHSPRASMSYPYGVWKMKTHSTTFPTFALSPQLSHPLGIWRTKTLSNSLAILALSSQLPTSIFETTTVVLRSQYLGHFSAKVWAIPWMWIPEVLRWACSERRAVPSAPSHRPLLLSAMSPLIQTYCNSHPWGRHCQQCDLWWIILLRQLGQ